MSARSKCCERVAAGKSNKLIAAELDIAEGTVKTHMKSILPKLDASDRTHAVMIASSVAFSISDCVTDRGKLASLRWRAAQWPLRRGS